MAKPDLHQLWSDFLIAWPHERVRQMTLDEYTNPNKDDAFIYWIESRLDKLGSIWGGSAFKFGIYCRDNTGTKEASSGRVWGQKYAWLAKYGSTEQQAFAAIRSRLIEVLDAIRDGNAARVEEVDLAPMLKWKVAFLYQDRSKPSLFPIFKKEALFVNYRDIDPGANLGSTPYHVMYETLLERHQHLGDVFGIARMLWEHYAEYRNRTHRIWAIPLTSILPEQDGIETLCSKTQVSAADIVPSLHEMLSSVDLAKSDRLVLFVEGDVRAIGTFVSVEPGQFGWDQEPESFASNLPVNPAELRELSAAEWETIQNHRRQPEPPICPPELALPIPRCQPRNIILYGPPGTGKTYHTTRRALELILSPERLAGMTGKGLSALFREHQARGQIEFVTFHQAYGYEEFVEGIRPLLNQAADAQVRYEIHDGVFKRIVLRAAAEGLQTEGTVPQFDELWNALVRDLAVEGTRIAKSSKEKTYQLELSSQRNILARACKVDMEGNVTFTADNYLTASKENARLYWEHRAELGPDPEKLSYEKTCQLFAREKGGTGGNHYTALWIVYTQLLALSQSPAVQKAELTDRDARVQQALDKPGPTTSFSFSARSPQYVLIIDEINRGNMSKILGELITLLEPDKRLALPNEIKLALSYSPHHRFAVPPNLHILGTMNTADRSIALMDVALRRRFEFEEQSPKAEVIRTVLQEHDCAQAFIQLVADVFNTVNDRIRFLYDRDHQLGHAYFLDVTDADSLRMVFWNRIIPMLQEYFYGAWDKICIVLGCPYNESGKPNRNEKFLLAPDSKTYANPFISASVFSETKTLAFDHEDYEDRVDYHVRSDLKQEGLSNEVLYRTFLGVLVLDGESYEQRLAELLEASEPAPPKLEVIP